MSTTDIELDDEMRDRLKALGEKLGRSPNCLVKQANNRYHDAEERYKCEKSEDMMRYTHYLDTGQHISHDELEKKADVKAKVSAE